MNIEYINKEFIQTLYNFANDIYKYTGNENAAQFISLFDKLNKKKISTKICETIGIYGDAICENNEIIFKQPFKILPDIDLSEIWVQLTTKQKGKIWTYLEVLYMTANILNQETEVETETETETSTTESSESAKFKPQIKSNKDGSIIAELGFNPYTGIVNDTETLTVTDLCSSTTPITDDQKPMNIASLTKNLGLDKMLKLDTLVQKLKEIDPDEIDNATTNLKNIMKSDENDKTANLIADIIGDVAKELKNDKFGSDNSDPLENIVRIAEKVSANMGNRMSEDGITAESMLSLAQNLSNKCNNGQNNMIDPMKLFGSILGSLNKGTTESPENILNHCKNMLSDLD